MNEANGPDWTAIRIAYESGPDSVKRLCEKFQIPVTALYRHRRKSGWVRRYPANRRKTLKRGNRRRVMVARFFEALDAQMQDIERSLATEDGAGETSATGRERDARTLSSLVRTLEKLFELDTGSDPAAKARKDAAHRDIEGLRQALADRIARLGRERRD